MGETVFPVRVIGFLNLRARNFSVVDVPLLSCLHAELMLQGGAQSGAQITAPRESLKIRLL